MCLMVRFALLCSLFLAGCWGKPDGPETVTVSGSVTVDGAPLSEGQISFRPEGGQLSGGAGKITDGKYSFQAPYAQMTVEITAFRAVPGKFVEDNPGEKTAVMEQYLPAKYNTQTELKADVNSKSKTFDFELSTK